MRVYTLTMNPPKPKPPTSQVIIHMLREKHSPKEGWATFQELPTTTGFAGQPRYIDFFAFNVWPSSNYRTVAYEVKVSRSDFLNEIKDPLKRKPSEEFASECYFVVPTGLVKPDEVPEGWGLMTAGDGGLRTVKIAEQRQCGKDLPVRFVAALARRCADENAPKGVPAPLWKYLGEEVTFEELLKAQKLDIDRFNEAARVQAEQQYSQEINFYRDAQRILGQRYLSGFLLESRLADAKSATRSNHDYAKMKAALAALQELVADEDKKRLSANQTGDLV